MRRIIKNQDSLIIKEKLIYNSTKDNSRLAKLLLLEQKGFCAYTEHYIGFDDANDIEHFNPNLKDKPNDNYYNWYKVKHLPNQRKSKNWLEPILMPYSEGFENRVIYLDGEYFAKPSDIEANNLIILLDLNNPIRVLNRKNYIKRRKESIIDRKLETKNDIRNYFQLKINSEIDAIRYIRAIESEFEIEIWSLISQKN